MGPEGKRQILRALSSLLTQGFEILSIICSYASSQKKPMAFKNQSAHRTLVPVTRGCDE